MKSGETCTQALRRELREELGVTPLAFEHIATLEEPRREVYGEHLYWVYLVTQWTGLPTNRQLSEHSEIRWFTLDEALSLNTAHPEYADLFRQAVESDTV